MRTDNIFILPVHKVMCTDNIFILPVHKVMCTGLLVFYSDELSSYQFNEEYFKFYACPLYTHFT